MSVKGRVYKNTKARRDVDATLVKYMMSEVNEEIVVPPIDLTASNNVRSYEEAEKRGYVSHIDPDSLPVDKLKLATISSAAISSDTYVELVDDEVAKLSNERGVRLLPDVPDEEEPIVRYIPEAIEDDIDLLNLPEHPAVLKVKPAVRHLGKITWNWELLKKKYVLGKRVQLEDGSYATQDYTYRELSEEYQISYDYLKQKAAKEKWFQLRQAYVARVTKRNAGHELNMYTQENYQGEVRALDVCDKLGIVLDKFIQHKFGEVLDVELDLVDGPDKKAVENNVTGVLSRLNPVTGMPLILSELKEAVNVTKEIYGLQKRIYDEAPKEDVLKLEHDLKKPKFRNEKDRRDTIQKLQQRLSGVLNPGEEVTTVKASKDV
jgi:hypothetical protein